MSTGNDGGARLVVSSDDHRAIVVIVIVICVLWSMMVIGARMIWRFHQKSEFGKDDVVALIGTIISIAQAGVTLGGVHFGFGKKIDLVESDVAAQAGQCLYAAAILYVIGLSASKASMPLLIARLTRDRRQVMWTNILLAVILAWGFASTFAVAFACGLPVPWIGEARDTCSGLFAAWTAIEVIGLLIEVLILAMAYSLVQNLNMLLKFKIAVVGSFTLRVLLAIPVGFRLALINENNTSSDPFFGNVKITIAAQLVLHYSLWAASFPCMRAFLRAFDTGLGVTTGVPTYKGSNYHNDSKGNSFAMRSIDRRESTNPLTSKPSQSGPSYTPTQPDAIEKILPPAKNPPSDGVRGTHASRMSDEESESSRRAIITRTVEWKINYEDAPGTAL